MSVESPSWICLTPTRNERWIVEPFLGAARTWANCIVAADQGSTDGTLEILQKTPKVEVVVNDSPIFDERHRQQLLIRRARELRGKRILIALDADEALSANCIGSREWRAIESAEPGTVLRFRWVNILPGFKNAWIPEEHRVFGFVDDGSEHRPTRIHSTRVPHPENAPVIDCDEIVVLHFQYVLWDRMMSKQRWYQAWENAEHGAKKPLQIFREYNHMFGSWDPDEVQGVQADWLSGYDRTGIDFRSLHTEPVTWWDREICNMLCKQGVERFRKVAIWDKDWNGVAKAIGVDRDLSDPRTPFERLTHRVLKATQGRRSNLGVRAFERLLRSAGW